MKQRNVFLIITVAITILVIALFASYWNSSIQISKSKVEAKITDFTADLGWYPIVGVTMIVFFNVTIQNTGSQNISGVQVTVQRLSRDNSSIANGSYTMINVGAINSGESRLVKIDWMFGLDNYNEYAHSNYLAILSVNGSRVLDDKSLY